MAMVYYTFNQTPRVDSLYHEEKYKEPELKTEHNLSFIKYYFTQFKLARI